MKQKIIRLLATLSLLAVLCVSLASCGASDPFDVYWQYLNGLENKADVLMPDKSVQVGAMADINEKTGERLIGWQAYTIIPASESVNYVYILNVVMSEVSDDYTFTYNAAYQSGLGGNPTLMTVAKGTVAASEFNGDDLLTFSEYSNVVMEENTDRNTATSLLKAMVEGMDQLVEKVELSAADFGFTAIELDASADADAPENTEEDLGGAFSGARWKYAGKMTLLGMGMVFLVLAILWGVLVIFEKCLYRPNKPAKPAKAAPAPAPSAPAVESAPAAPAATDDGVLLAVITAAVAAAMEEEGTPSNGFRVVSFKKTTGRGGPWNG